MKSHVQAVMTPDDGFAYYWSLLKPWSKIVATVTLVAMSATYVFAKSCLIPYYRATAVIRPVSKADQGSLVSGMLAGASESAALLTGLSSDEEKDAERFTSILTSYVFTTELLKRTNLAPRLVERSLTHRLFGWPISDYGLYKKTAALFDADFSLKTENIDLAFEDPNRADAQRILGIYLDMLRGRLREHEVESATAAISSLQKEVAAATDPQLQASLSDEIARQMERRDTAQVQADFSFEVIDPPIAADQIYRPRIGLDCAVVAILTSFIFALIIIAREHVSMEARKRGSPELSSAPGPMIEAEPLPVSHRVKRQG